MQTLDLELERQQADEELTQLLGGLVVQPLNIQFGERLQSELFTFGEDLDNKLRQQLAPLVKFRDLKRSCEELEQCFEDGLRLLQQQQRDLGSQLADDKQANSQRSEALQALAGQLKQTSQHLTQNNHQLHDQLKTQLKQQQLALREQLSLLEQADSQHADAQQASVQALAGQVTAAQQSLNDNQRQLHGQLSAQLLQQAQALREQLVDKQEQGAQSLLDRLQQQSTTHQEQLQRVHAELSALQHLPHEVLKLQKQAASEQQQVSGLLQQQQALLAQQQKELQRLRRALSIFAWTGLVLGGMSCAGIALLALHTPAIRTLLG